MRIQDVLGSNWRRRAAHSPVENEDIEFARISKGYEGRPATGQDRDVCAGPQCERLKVSISRPLVPGEQT
jgi:hypothetical protein